MANAVKTTAVQKRAAGGSVDLMIDPKTPNLDSLVHDILGVAGKATALIPSCVVKSVEVFDSLAVVRAISRGSREAEIRLYRQESGEWEIRVCAYH